MCRVGVLAHHVEPRPQTWWASTPTLHEEIMPTTLETRRPQAAPAAPASMSKARKRSLFDPEITIPAIFESFKKLNPVHMVKNPVMFVTEVGAAVTTVELFFAHAHGE